MTCDVQTLVALKPWNLGAADLRWDEEEEVARNAVEKRDLEGIL